MSTVQSRNRVQDLAYVAVFTALIIALAFVAIPVGTAGVPIVLQNAAIILAGLVLGPKRGLYVALLFLGIGLLGLPVLSGGKSALAAISGPTVGYLVGYIFAAFIAGAIAYAAPKNKKSRLLAFLIVGGIAGLFLQYFFGVIGLILRAKMELMAAITAQGPFILLDLGKLAIVVIIAMAVHAAFPDLRNRTR
ncbi:MAG: biotin transporter BioY [Corynebacterium sp.]|uniref:biotin transporter BioY n=1 Tax=Corynebacterium sp. TaxID=1720 RepID=UPI0026DC484A|nr:biotin transporter BioY [Corynebacterium sp.]MDO4760754.1 biotin transporter BioY [Corynebacterium sp.]